jgi:hypothetical protein
MISIATVRRCVLTMGLAIALGVGAGCGGDDDGGSSGTVSEGCDRLDECNALRPGLSADECVEMVENDLEALTPSQRNDWDTVMNGCLAFDTCDLFISCLDANGL